MRQIMLFCIFLILGLFLLSSCSSNTLTGQPLDNVGDSNDDSSLADPCDDISCGSNEVCEDGGVDRQG